MSYPLHIIQFTINDYNAENIERGIDFPSSSNQTFKTFTLASMIQIIINLYFTKQIDVYKIWNQKAT